MHVESQTALEEDEEIEAVLSQGVTTNIKFKAVSDILQSGKREVFFGRGSILTSNAMVDWILY